VQFFFKYGIVDGEDGYYEKVKERLAKHQLPQDWGILLDDAG